MKKHLTLLLLAAFMALSGAIQAQSGRTTVTIGTGTSAAHDTPFAMFYKNSTVQMVYLASDINHAGMIDTIWFYANTTNQMAVNSLKIYLGTTSSTSLSSMMTAENFDEVYSATSVTIGPGSAGWQAFALAEPFYYDGVDNLVVCCCKHHSAYQQANTFRYTATTGAVRYVRNDSDVTAGDLESVTSSTMGTTSTYRANIKLGFNDNYVPPSCLKVANLQSSNITSNSATIAWSETGTATQWVVEYHNASFTPGTGVGTIVYASDTTATLSDLLPNTTYYVAVHAVCGAGDTSMNRMTSFRTQCGPMSTIPFTMDFESASTTTSSSTTFMECWHHLNNGSYPGYPYISSTSSYNHTPGGTKGLYWYYYTTASSYGDYQIVVLPGLNTQVHPISTLQLKFWAKASTATARPVFRVGVMTDPDDETTFQELSTINVVGTEWTEYEAPLSLYHGAGEYVAIRADLPTTSWTAYVDDITLDLMPSCPKTSEISVVEATMTSVTLHWDEYGSATSWTIEYDTADFVPGTYQGQIVIADNTTYTLANLEPGLTYNIYLHANCSEGDTSENRYVSATTLASMPASVPYTCDFEEEGNNGWSFANDATNAWYIDSAIYRAGTKSLYVSNTGGTTYAYDPSAGIQVSYAYRPIEFTTTGEYGVRYDWRCNGEGSYDYMRFFLAPASASFTPNVTPTGATPYNFASVTPEGWIALDGGGKLNLNNAWTTELRAVRVPEGSYYLVVMWANDASGGTTPGAAIDNVSIEAATCPGIDSVYWETTETTATITSYYSGTPSEFMLIYQARDAQAPDTAYSYSGIFELTDIAAGSYYDASIYTICGADTTFSIYEFNFKTDCAIISEFPWDYGFENATWFHYTSGTTTMYWPYCWNAANKGGSTSYNWRQCSTVSNTRTGDGAAYFYSTTTAATQAALDEWFVTPTIALTGNEQLSFWVKGTSSTTSANYHTRVSVRVSDEYDFEADSLYTNVPLSGGDVCNGGYYTDLVGTTYTQYFADLSGFSGNRRIAFVVDTNSYSFYMDDLRLITLSNCPDAFNVRVEGFTPTTANLAWSDTASNPTTTSWDIYYGTPGFSADTVSPITVYDTTYVLEGLEPQTDYEYFVIAHCSDGSDANATTPLAFTTACAAVSSDDLPYVEDFEAYGTGTTSPISPCWTKSATSGSYYPYPYSTAAIHGTRGLYFYSYLSTTAGATPTYDWATLPLFETDINALRLRFNTKRYTTVSANYKCRLYIGVMSDPYDITTFDTVAYIDHSDAAASSIASEEVYFDQYEGEGSYIAIMSPIPEVGGQYNHVYLDDIVVDSIPECRRSTNLTAENITINSADLSWNNTSVVPVSNYTVAYSTNSDFDPATCTTTEITSATNLTLTGLNSYTRYYWAVKANCSDDAEWSDIASFTTPFDCGPGNVENILDTIGDGATTGYTYTTYAYTSYPKGKTYMIFTAQELMEMGLQTNNIINSISLQSGTTGGTLNGLSVYMAETDLDEFSSTAADDTMARADMQLVYSGDKNFEPSTWNEIFFDTAYSYSGTHNLMILLYRDQVPSANATFYYGTVPGSKYRTCYGYQSASGTTISATRSSSRDNIAFNICTTIPSCERPDSVTITDLQPTSATITWIGTASNYEVAYGLQGIDPDGSDATFQLIATNTFTMAGLNPQTTYDFYVRSRCSNPTDTSNWTFLTRFSTPCLPQALPYSEDFESYASGAANPIDPCWTKGTNSSTAYPYPYATNPVTGLRSLYFYAYHPSTTTSTPYYSYAALPMMTAPVDSLMVSFKMRRYSTTTDSYTSRIVVGLMSDPADITTFTAVDTFDLKNEASLSVHGFEVSFAGHTDDGQFIAFYDEIPPLYGSGTTSYSYVYLDDVVVDYIPTCPTPANIVVVDSTITGSSAVVSWTDRATATLGYELEYGPAGFEFGTGTRIHSATNPTAISGLLGGTNYEVYVRAICSATDTGNWAFPASFSTVCVPITSTPFTMDFENEATGTSSPLPICWTRFNNSTSTSNYYPYINSSTTYAHSGTKYLYFYGYNSTSYAENQIASLPEVDTNILPMSSLELHFWGRGSSSSSTTSTTYMSQLLVGVMSDPTNLATFQLVDTVNMNGTLAEYVVDFGNYHGNGSYVSIQMVKPTTTSTYNYAYIDDITLQQVPECPSVYDIAVTDIDSNRLAITWSDSVNYSWTVEYGPEGFEPGTGTIVPTYVDSLTVNNLATGTRYTFIVTPYCSGLVYPTTATFRTATTYYALPFADDFETPAHDDLWVFENGTNTNAWYTGTATNNGGSRSLYISNDHGTSNAYTVGAASLSYAYVNLDLRTPGSYEYSFDWKAQGESTYDYIQVALVPVSEDIESVNGTTVPSGMTASSVPASWISLHPGLKLNLDSTWSTITDVVSLPNPGIYHLVFAWRNDGSGGAMPPAAIDNVVFQRSTCSRPENLQIADVTAQSATISWTETGTATQWQYTLDGVNYTDVTSTTVLLSNLIDGTNYTLGVRAVCGDGDTSFAITQNFTTPCFPRSASDTIFDDFEGYATAAYNTAGDKPMCWDGFSNGTDAAYMPHVVNSGTSYNYSHSGSGALEMTSGDATRGDTKIAVLPLLAEPVSAVKINFWYRMESLSYGTLTVGYVTGPDYENSFVPVRTLTSILTFTQDSVSFENVPDEAYRIAFKWVHTASFYTCAIDDITITADVACPAPTITSVTNDYQSADVTWSGYGSAYEVQIRTLEGTYDEPVTVAGNSYHFAGLQPATMYLFQVRQDCNADSNGYSTWTQGSFITDSLPCFTPTDLTVSNVSFTTADFSWNTLGTETAWEIHVFNTMENGFVTVTTNPATIDLLTPGTTYSAAIRALCGAEHNVEGEWSDTIQFTTDICDPVTNVHATADGLSISLTWTAGENNCGNFEVEYGEHGFGQGEGTIVTVNNVTSKTFTGLYEETTYDFYVRAVCAEGLTSAWSAVASATTGQATGDECYAPTDVNATANGNSITFTWTAATGNTAEFEVEYGQAGFAHGQGTTAQAGPEGFTANNLEANTTYDFYVRAICQTGNYSDWSDKASATTGNIGIYDVEGSFNCNIFPNPATDETTISVSGVNGMVTIAVVDMNGRTVSSETLDCAADCVKKMNVSGLTQGAYFVRIYGENVNSVKKLIVR